LVHDGLEVAEKIGEFSTKGSIDRRGEGGLKHSSKRNICKGYALGCKESTGSKMLFEYGESRSDAVLEDSVDLERELRGTRLKERRLIAHRLIVRVDGTLDKLKNEGVVRGNV
jgi:hypothetical protein